MNKWTTVRLVLGILLICLIIFTLMNMIDFRALPSIFLQVDPWVLSIAVALKLFTLYVKTVRWGIAMMATGIRQRPKKLFVATLIGAGVNVILPARSGELVRTLIAKKYNDQNGVTIFTSLSAMLLLDLVLLALLFLVFLPFDQKAGSLKFSTTVILAIGTGIVILLALLTTDKLTGVEKRLGKHWQNVGRKLRQLRIEVIRSIKVGLAILTNPLGLLQALVLTIFLWVVEVIALWLALIAFSISPSIQLTLFLLAALNLSFLMALTPANIGVHQLLSVLILGHYGTDYSEALAFSIGFQSLVIFTFVITGSACFYWLGVRPHKSNTK